MEKPLRRLLTHPWLPIHLAALSVVLTLPALWAGWQIDDWFHQGLLRGIDVGDSIHDPFTGMFDFLGGSPGRAAWMRDRGFAPWWLPDAFHARFFRPVTVATHVFDNAVAPTSAVFAHAHSIAWSALVVALAALLFGEIHGVGVVAGLAALLYTLDESRGLPTGWVANRSALVALVFGISSLLAHHRWRARGWARGRRIGPLLLAVALLSAESGLSTTAYLFAYSLFIDRGSLRERLLRLVPYALVVVAWRIGYSAAGFGASGSGLYLDPVVEPIRFLRAVAVRYPVLLLAQWTSLPSIPVSFVDPALVRLSLVPGVAVLAAIGALVRPVLRASAAARMWAVGMLVSAIPICATFPSNRLLGFVALGGAGLLAETVSWYRVEAASARRIGAGFARILLVWSLVAGFTGLPLQSHAVKEVGGLLVEPCDRVLGTDPAIADKTVIYVNSNALCTAYGPIRRIIEGLPAPRRVRLLASAVYEVRVTGIDEHSVRLSVRGGFHSHPADQLLRSGDDPLPVGAVVRLTGMRVTVLDHNAAGLVADVLVRFDKPLRDPELVWFATRNLELGPFTPPEPGQTIVLPAAFGPGD